MNKLTLVILTAIPLIAMLIGFIAIIIDAIKRKRIEDRRRKNHKQD